MAFVHNLQYFNDKKTCFGADGQQLTRHVSTKQANASFLVGLQDQ